MAKDLRWWIGRKVQREEGGFGGGGNDDCGERGGRANLVVTSSFSCEHEAGRSSTLVIRAMVSLDGGGDEGGISSVSKVCVGATFLGGEPNLTFFLPFLPAAAIKDLRFCFAGCGFIRDFDFLREGETNFLLNTDLTSADYADVPAALGDGGRSLFFQGLRLLGVILKKLVHKRPCSISVVGSVIPSLTREGGCSRVMPSRNVW